MGAETEGVKPETEGEAEAAAAAAAVQLQKAYRAHLLRRTLTLRTREVSERRRKHRLAAVFAHFDTDSTGRLHFGNAAGMFAEDEVRGEGPPPSSSKESWAALCGLLGVEPAQGITLEDLERLYSPSVLGTTASQHLDGALERT
jgi:hypothetical protein|eukprot:COSAG01_NODE_3167_length_6474_cov_2.587765_5_plen_144_part_00